MYSVAPITVDGVPVGTVTFGDEEDVASLGLADLPLASPDASAARSLADYLGGHRPSHTGLGGQGSVHHQHGPYFRHGIGPGARHHAEEHRGPTFRRGVGPGSKSHTVEEHPRHFTTGDVNKAVIGHGLHHITTDEVGKVVKGQSTKTPRFDTKDIAAAVKGGTPGAPDRSKIAKELEGNEALTRRYAQMVVGEIYYDRATERAKLAQAETAANRALKRGHSLEQALWLHGSGTDRLGGVGHGESGYYPATTFNRGMTEAQYKDFKENILPKVLAGSNEARGFTGNASADVADRQRARGTPVFDLRNEGGDQYFDEDVGKTMPRQPGRPVGVESLAQVNNPVGVTRFSGSTPGMAGAKMAADGKSPEAFIMHHTGPGMRTPEDVVNVLRNRGLGVQYIMDREGNVHDVAKEYGYHNIQNIMNGWGKGAGLNNSNVVGMEVMAADDKDVNQKQVEGAKRFIREHYSGTTVLGHGEVNPGHKEADEGKTITDAINAERASRAKSQAAGNASKIAFSRPRNTGTVEDILPKTLGSNFASKYPLGAAKEINPDYAPGHWVGAGKNRVWVPEKKKVGIEPNKPGSEVINPDVPAYKPPIRNLGAGKNRIPTPGALPDPDDDE